MRKRNWKSARPSSLDEAIELCADHASEVLRRPAKVMADLMGVELKTYYTRLLSLFGKHCKGRMRDIYYGAISNIDEPKNLEKIITTIDDLDWYSAKAFEVVQIDLKYIVDQKALSMQQIQHVYSHKLPLFQWTAIDVNSRFRLLAYSYERTWTNGLTWFLWVLSWLRSHGVTAHIIFTVDHGEEFGGKSWLKIFELKKLLSEFGCTFIQNRPKHPEENPHIERSHRTDDDEFYIPRILSINSPKEFFFEAMNYLYYYNVVRRHSSLGRQSPFAHLAKTAPDLDDKIRFVPPIFLDYLAVQLGDWSGYHLLASYPAQHQGLAFDGMLKRCCSIWIRICLVQKFPVEFELD